MRKILLSALLLLTACLPSLEGPDRTGGARQPVDPWANALRALDLADTATPANDITAVYLHQDIEYLQIRIDLLDFRSPNELSLDIRIGDVTSPEAAPLDLHIPSESDSARVSFGPLLDTVIVEVPLSTISSRPRVDVTTPEDEISGLTLDGPVPNRTVPLLLTFYDTFTGRFPAEALRSWDGAHTGPRGERHGLRYLLDAAEEYQVPIVLLDLKEPANLSALDAMDVLSRIKRLAEAGLLILPENETVLEAASSPSESATRAQVWGKEFGLPISPFSYATATTGFQFDFLEDRSHLVHPFFSKITYLPIATEADTTQPTPDGPSLEIRRALLETALNADKRDMLVSGGSLANSTWGSPDMLGPTLAYFVSRPYIHILTTDDLTNFPTKSGEPQFQPVPTDERIKKLETLYQNLTLPVLDYAENWIGSSISACDNDIDNDGQAECILANENTLAILDPQGARLTYLFTREGENLHQLVGPSWQVAVGLSNPSTWDLSAGEAADPGAYPGAFADADDPFKAYEPAIEGDTLVFTSLDSTRVKTFKLIDAGIEAEYQTQEPVRTQIPLLVDPDTRFTPGWAEKYFQQNTPDGVAWGLGNGPMVSIHIVPVGGADDPVSTRAFNESLSLLGTSENPDFDYPAGHYVPFPMGIAEVEMGDGYFLRLERLP